MEKNSVLQQQQPLIAFSIACYIVTYASSPINIDLNLLWPVAKKPVNAPLQPSTWSLFGSRTKHLQQANKGSALQPSLLTERLSHCPCINL
jgi:hypothetical protein